MSPDLDAPDVTRDRPLARRRWARSMGRWMLRLALAVVIAILALMGFAAWTVRASLPMLDGHVRAPVSAPTTIARDGIGMVTIAGATRRDVAFATGYAHAQDRFFQMDLARRRAAGELAALVGRVALDLDRRTRVHRFRSVARDIVAATLQAPHRALLDAYTQGVNAGLASLARKPFEYYVLQSEPEAWTPEDSVLVLYSMFLSLQDDRGAFESDRGVMHDILPTPLYEFLTAPGGDWDSPLDAAPLATPEVPPASAVNVSEPRAAWRTRLPPHPSTPLRDLEDRVWTPHAGSNNWAVAGSRTASGRALVANDMHLNLSVPHIWYRASLAWGEQEASRRSITGVMLPGAPAVVVGSNTDVAWGFTNTEGDWSDLVLLESPPDQADAYLTPDGAKPFTHHAEAIAIKGEAEELLDVRWTIWGPVVDEDHLGRPRALRWTAHDPRAVNFDLIDLEDAQSVAEALSVAHRAGIPAQNMVIGDHKGSIAWTIAGRMPRRVGCDGQLPRSWATSTCGWQGYLDDTSVPRIVDPPSGVLATANNRVASGEALRAIGLGRYDEGARARTIIQALEALPVATPPDMLAIQLDDRARFLERWRTLAMRTLDASRGTLTPDREAFRTLVETEWTGRASVDSSGYRLVRTFRGAVADSVLTFLTRECKLADPRFDPLFSTNYEGAVWKLVNERPEHLLDPRFPSWQELLLAAVDQAVSAVRVEGEPLERRTWGERNTLRMRHPLSSAVPGASRWLDMPSEPLPGDAHMPRVQGVSHAASERMAVSPGREAEGYLHMPGGQSGHPWSQHYRDGHAAWVEGTPQPFLPAAGAHALVLEPSTP